MANAFKLPNLSEALSFADVRLMLESSDEKVLIKGLKCLSSQLRDDTCNIQEIIDLGFLTRVAELLKTNNVALKTAATELVCKVATGTTAQTKAVVDAGCLESIVPLLSHDNTYSSKKAYLVFHKVCECSHREVCALVDAGVFGSLLKALPDASKIYDQEAEKMRPFSPEEMAILLATSILQSIFRNSDALYYKKVHPLLLKYSRLFCCESQNVRIFMNTVGKDIIFQDFASLSKEMAEDLLPIFEQGLQRQRLTEDAYLAAPYLQLVLKNIGRVETMLKSGTFNLVRSILDKLLVLADAQQDQQENWVLMSTTYLVINLCAIMNSRPQLSPMLMKDGYLSSSLKLISCQNPNLQIVGLTLWFGFATATALFDNGNVSENVLQLMIKNNALTHVNKCFCKLLTATEEEQKGWVADFDDIAAKIVNLCFIILKNSTLYTTVLDSGLLKTVFEMLDYVGVKIRITILRSLGLLMPLNNRMLQKMLVDLNIVAKIASRIVSLVQEEANVAVGIILIILHQKAPITEFEAGNIIENVDKFLAKNQGKNLFDCTTALILNEIRLRLSEVQLKKNISGFLSAIKKLLTTNSEEVLLETLVLFCSIVEHKSLRLLCLPLVKTLFGLAATASNYRIYVSSTIRIPGILHECGLAQLKENFCSSDFKNLATGLINCIGKNAVTEGDFVELRFIFSMFNQMHSLAEAAGLTVPYFEMCSTLIKLTKNTSKIVAEASTDELLRYLLIASGCENGFQDILRSGGGVWFFHHYEDMISKAVISPLNGIVLHSLSMAVIRYAEVSRRYENEVRHIREIHFK